MAKLINLTDRFSLERPKIVIGEHTFEVDDSIATATKFQELAQAQDMDSMKEAMKLILGEESIEKLDYDKLSLGNLKTLNIAIMAAIQGISYEDAESRFQD